MRSLEDALETILAQVGRASTEVVPLTDAAGRHLADTLKARLDLPPFDNSAMDGYAVRAADTTGASSANPKALRLVAHIPAGTSPAHTLQSGECARIFTGSPVPQGADAVIMQEDTRPGGGDGAEVELIDTVRPWENIRFRGEDVKAGTVLLPAGRRLGAGQVALLGAQGFAELPVARQPRVGLLSTGTELAEPGQPLAPGHIYESNRAALAVMARQAGAVPLVQPPVGDTLEATVEALRAGLEACDLLVTSGGVSVGEHDLVKKAFQQLGGQTDFWKVAIKPGKPFVFGRLQEKLWFGLPGNPVSALVTFFLLVRPAILRWQGAEEVRPPLATGTLSGPMENRGERRHFLRIYREEDGRVSLAGTQASNMLSSLARANALLDLPPGASWGEGKTVSVMLLDA